jgi:hypothetical protein
MRACRRMVWLSASCLAMMGSTSVVAKELTLRIEPEDGTTFMAHCTFETDGKSQTFDLEGAELVERRFQGEALSCRIIQTSEGGLLVDMRTSTGSSSRSSTSGAAGGVTVISIG